MRRKTKRVEAELLKEEKKSSVDKTERRIRGRRRPQGSIKEIKGVKEQEKKHNKEEKEKGKRELEGVEK